MASGLYHLSTIIIFMFPIPTMHFHLSGMLFGRASVAPGRLKNRPESALEMRTCALLPLFSGNFSTHTRVEKVLTYTP